MQWGGSVLTLFTNRREMESFYRELKPRLANEGIDLIAQTRGTSTKSLRDRFLSDRSLSMFALKSFWEGFDAPGDTLRCVIIARLPFSRPDDPIAREREARDGRAAWGRYSLPEAVMDLKQAAGRLIRNSTDSGWLVLADAVCRPRTTRSPSCVPCRRRISEPLLLVRLRVSWRRRNQAASKTAGRG